MADRGSYPLAYFQYPFQKAPPLPPLIQVAHYAKAHCMTSQLRPVSTSCGQVKITLCGVPCTAPQTAPATLWARDRASIKRYWRVEFDAILDPFPDITVNIIKSESVRTKRPNGG